MGMNPVCVPWVVQSMCYMVKPMWDGRNAHHLNIFYCRPISNSFDFCIECLRLFERITLLRTWECFSLIC